MARTVEIRPLSPSDDRSTFCCGEPAIDRFFEFYAGQNQFKLPSYPLPIQKLGFTRLEKLRSGWMPGQPTPMFLDIRAIEAALTSYG